MNEVSYIIESAKAIGAATARAKVWDHYIAYGMKQPDKPEEKEKVDMIMRVLKAVIEDLDVVVDKFSC